MKITKAIWDTLPAGAFKDAFKPEAGNADSYDNGEEAVAGLKSALEKEKTEKAEFGKKLAEYDAAKQKEIEAERKKALEEARTNGDFAKIEADYQKQLKELRESVSKAENDRQESIKRETINKHADELAKMFVSPSLAKPAILARLNAEIVDGKPIVRVLDRDGQASASSVEDLKKEFLTDKELKGSIVASKGSGGGSTNSISGGGSTGTDDKFDAANASPKDLVARLKAKGIDTSSDD